MILAADNLNSMNPVVMEALDRLDPKPIQDIARQCDRAGAGLIDINPGYLSRRREDRMAFMVEAVQEVCSLPLILDSPNPTILAKGLAVCRETPVLNAATGEEGRLEETVALAAEHRTTLIILLLDKRSYVPPSLDEKLALALEIREHALSAGLGDQDLIVDPVLPNFSWHDAFSQVAEVIKTVRLLASGAVFGDPVRTMVGLSNLRSGLRRHHDVEIERTCLGMLAGAGLDLVLADALSPELVSTWQQINRMQ